MPAAARATSLPDNLYLRGGVYWGRVKVKGRDIRRSLHTASLREAKERLRRLIAEAQAARSGDPAARPEALWEEAVERWIALHNDELEPSTQVRYAISLRHLHHHFAGRPVASISQGDISDFVAARRKEGVTSSTCRRDLAVAARVFKVAKRAGWIAANPVPEEKAELAEGDLVVGPVATRHIATMIRRAQGPKGGGTRPHMAELIGFIARTGCRKDEAAALQWGDVDLAKRQVTFCKTKTVPRVIQITQRLATIMAGWQRGRPNPDGSHYVFCDSDGAKLRYVSQRFIQLRERNGLPHFRLHDLRHTYGIRRLQADQRPQRRDEQARGLLACAIHMGHASTKTTEIYLKWLLRSGGNLSF